MIVRATLIAALLMVSTPVFADAPDCASLPTQDEIDTCVFDRLQASSAELSATVSKLRDEAKELDKNKTAEDGEGMGEKLNRANLSFNAYIQATCSYLADRHTEKDVAKKVYSSCNQQMIDQRLELLTTQTAP